MARQGLEATVQVQVWLHVAVLALKNGTNEPGHNTTLRQEQCVTITMPSMIGNDGTVIITPLRIAAVVSEDQYSWSVTAGEICKAGEVLRGKRVDKQRSELSGLWNKVLRATRL